jgi:hypothetical protein
MGFFSFVRRSVPPSTPTVRNQESLENAGD